MLLFTRLAHMEGVQMRHIFSNAKCFRLTDVHEKMIFFDITYIHFECFEVLLFDPPEMFSYFHTFDNYVCWNSIALIT